MKIDTYGTHKTFTPGAQVDKEWINQHVETVAGTPLAMRTEAKLEPDHLLVITERKSL